MIDDLAKWVLQQDMYTVSPMRPSSMLGKQGPRSTLWHLPKHYPYNYTIHLKEGAQPLASTLYGMSRNEIEELRRYLEDNLSKEFIRTSRS